MKLKDYSNLKEMLIDFNEYSTDYTKTRCRELEETIKNTLKEIERLNNIIKHTDSWIDRTIEIIKQQPSEDDTWILERLNGIKQCLKEVNK